MEWKDKYPYLTFTLLPIYNVHHYNKRKANTILMIKYIMLEVRISKIYYEHEVKYIHLHTF